MLSQGRVFRRVRQGPHSPAAALPVEQAGSANAPLDGSTPKTSIALWHRDCRALVAEQHPGPAGLGGGEGWSLKQEEAWVSAPETDWGSRQTLIYCIAAFASCRGPL